MSEITINSADKFTAVTSDRLLSWSGQFWYFMVLVGQCLFTYYIVAFYYSATLSGDFQKWNDVLFHGYKPNDFFGNLFLGIHLLLAASITLGGLAQLFTPLRTNFPGFHRYNGYFYLLSALIMAFTGLYLNASRGVVGGQFAGLGVNLNALIIIACAVAALYLAVKSNIVAHRRWALRLFVVVSGVWFFRVGLMLWLLLNQGPVGFDPKTFTGPFLDVLGFASYLLPLFILECYFRAQTSKAPWLKTVGAGSLCLLTLLMGLGIFAVTKGLWLPRV